MWFRSFSKVNLHLQVVGRREDGYHELRTIFQTVDLSDDLWLEARELEGVVLEVEGGSVDGGRDNLVVRAAERFLARWAPGRGVRAVLRKRVPVGGGLGGGSADAAATLLGLQQVLGTRVPPSEVWAEARALGADVPFFLTGGLAFGCGRGDEIVPLPDGPGSDLWLVVPPVEIPTSAVFAALAGRDLDPVLEPEVAAALARSDAVDLLAIGRNDLEAIVLPQWPLVETVYNALRVAGAEIVRLSGSGATIVARFAEPRAHDEISCHLPTGTRIVRARTLGRQEVEGLRLLAS